MKALLIKLTSMGDLTHALPAITDAATVYPDIQFDWVVDEGFAEIPGWHPNVNRVIKTAHRRWKKNKRQTWLQGEFAQFYAQLNRDQYDVMFDAQNNLKSAVISLLRRGKVAGCDRQTAREYPAHWAYAEKYHIPLRQHAIARQRQLFAEVLGYPLPDTPADYGVDLSRLKLPAIELPDNYLVLVHNASWDTKLWPEDHWLDLIQQLADAGYSLLLPCGNDEEYQRAQRLAATSEHAMALPRLSLSEIAAVMNNARGAVCCDTGLAHIGGMLSLPSVSLYGPTDDQLIGAFGEYQVHHVARDFECAPCYKKRCDYSGQSSATAACMQAFSPEKIITDLNTQIQLRADALNNPG